MIQLTHTVLFYLHRKDREAACHPLVMRVHWNGSRSMVTLNVGFSVDPEKWSAEEQMCRRGSFHGPLGIPARTINSEMERWRNTVDDVFSRFASSDIWPTVDQVRGELRIALGIDDPKVLRTDEAFDMFMKEESVRCTWSEATRKKLRTLRRRIAAYPLFVTLDGFTSANLSGYLSYLRDVEGHNDNTIAKDLGYLRWFCSWAEKKRFLHCDDYRVFRPKLRKQPKPVVFLRWRELMDVFAFEGSEEQNGVRDVFLFSCFTSLRYSDVMALTWDCVGDDSFTFTAQKTGKRTVIQLNRWSTEILSRYIDVSVPGNHVFPRIPNQVCNRYLKEIARACGIDERVVVTEYHGAERSDESYEKWSILSTHAGRRTFICNSLMMGIPPTVVMQWTGHSDYRAMKPYIAITDEEAARRMEEWDTKR